MGFLSAPFDANAKCIVEGKEYKEGEEFYPLNTCLKCICGKGFQGKLEKPFCQRRMCGQQVQSRGLKIQNSCAAFYHLKNENVLCCPDDWICRNTIKIVCNFCLLLYFS